MISSGRVHMLEPFGAQQGGEEINEQQQRHNGRQQQHEFSFSNLVAADDKREHQSHRCQTKGDHRGNPGNEVHQFLQKQMLVSQDRGGGMQRLCHGFDETATTGVRRRCSFARGEPRLPQRALCTNRTSGPCNLQDKGNDSRSFVGVGTYQCREKLARPRGAALDNS